jgi:hypothetical protein
LKETKPKHGDVGSDSIKQAFWCLPLESGNGSVIEAVNNPQHAVAPELSRGIGKSQGNQNPCFDVPDFPLSLVLLLVVGGNVNLFRDILATCFGPFLPNLSAGIIG